VIKINTAHSEQSVRIGFTDQRLTAYGGMAFWSAFLHKRKVRAELQSFLPQTPTSPNAYEPTSVQRHDVEPNLRGRRNDLRVVRSNAPKRRAFSRVHGVQSRPELSGITALYFDDHERRPVEANRIDFAAGNAHVAG